MSGCNNGISEFKHAARQMMAAMLSHPENMCCQLDALADRAVMAVAAVDEATDSYLAQDDTENNF